MKGKQYGLMLVLALLTGLAGGVVSSRFYVPDPALAVQNSEAQTVVVAREFRLVDANGNTIAILGGHPGKEPFLPIEPGLRFYDKHGELRILLGLIPGEKPFVGFFGSGGKAIWEAP